MPLDPERVQTLFLEAVEYDHPEDRAVFLDRECAGDTTLRDGVESLLRAHGALGPSPADVTIAQTPTPRGESGTVDGRERASSTAEGPGARIGPYRLLEEIGEGGMGTVYMAEQEEPVRRRVALKIIKVGMDSHRVVARFEAERQALAMMDHPNIARVFDAGTTDAGRPYFVMELVQGVPITKFCDDTRLAPRERLGLFAAACQAIQHAHQKGIIHRDIKPSNVLVTVYDGVPTPKVIDFGIAKATDQRPDDGTMFTEFGTIVGTLEYMSPEQAGMGAQGVDTRSDIYSLGVLLYELLTGTTPLQKALLKEAGLVEILKRIKDEDPPSPSTRLCNSKERLAAVSALRKMEPSKLTRLLRGDLDWIVMKALEKDRARRYETASGFARDIQRYLAGDAIEARPPTAGYRLAKFARKNRAALATASAFAVMLVLGAVLSLWQAIRATRAESHARTEADRAIEAEAQAVSEGEKARRSAADAHAVLGFFEDRVLAAARPQGQKGGLGKDVTVRAAVDAAEPTIAASFRDRPIVEARVRASLGSTYRYLGEPALTARQLERALELRKATLGPDDPDTLASQNALAMAYLDAGRLDRAIPSLEQTLAARKARLGDNHPDTLASQNSLAMAYKDDGRRDLAIPLYEQTMAARKAKLGDDHPDTLLTQNDLAVALKEDGRLDLAIPLFEQTLAARSAKLGADHPETLTSQNNLAAAYKNSGRSDLAIPLFERTLASRTAKLGADHPNTLNSRNNLASAYRDAGQFDRAIPLLESTLAARKAKLGADHPDTLASQYSLALALKDAGRTDEAIALLERTLATRKARLGPEHPDVLKTQNNLALTYRDAGQFGRAVTLFEQTLAVEKARLGVDHPDTLITENNLALTYRDDWQVERSIPLFERTYATRTSRIGADHPDTLLTASNLAMAYREAGLWDRSITLFERTLAVQSAKLGADHPSTLLTQNNLAPAYQGVGQVDRAIDLLERTLAAREAKLGEDHPSTLTTRNNLALSYRDADRLDRAIALFERTLADRTKKHGADHPRTLGTRHDLAEAYRARGESARAEPMLRGVIAARETMLGPDHPAVAATLTALGTSLLDRREWSVAEPILRVAVSIFDAKSPDAWPRFEAQSLLGACLLGLGKYDEAEPLLLGGYEGVKAREARLPASSKIRVAEAGGRVTQLYEAWGKPVKADAWRAKLAPPVGSRKP